MLIKKHPSLAFTTLKRMGLSLFTCGTIWNLKGPGLLINQQWDLNRFLPDSKMMHESASHLYGCTSAVCLLIEQKGECGGLPWRIGRWWELVHRDTSTSSRSLIDELVVGTARASASCTSTTAIHSCHKIIKE